MSPPAPRPRPGLPIGPSVALALALAGALATGPASAQWRAEGPVAGTVNDLAVDPTNPDTLYAGTAGGGVWRSTDAGRTWEQPSGDLTNYTVEWVEVDPADPARLWAAVDQRGPSAMFRSTDRGASWKRVTDRVQGELGNLHAVGQRVAFAPGKPGTMFVPSTNLHYRTEDGGKTWRDFRVPNQDAYAFAVHPSDPRVVLAAGRGETLNLSRSTDGGKTWRQTGSGLAQNSIRRIFFDPADPAVVWAVGGTFRTVFRSTDGGDEWETLELPIGGTDEVFDLSPAPGTGTLWAATEGGLLRSADRGASWQRVGRFGGYLAKRVAFDPRNPRRLWAAAGGTGVWASTDGGDSWTPSSNGLFAGWTEELYAAPGAAAVFAQLSVGLFRLDGGRWTELREPFADGKPAEIDGVLFDRSNPQVAWAYSGSSHWTSADGGRRWTAYAQKEPSMRDLMRGNLATPEFNSLAQDAGNPRVLYAGAWSGNDPGQSVWRSIDGGKTWKPAGAGLPEESVQRLLSTAADSVLAIVDREQLWRTTGGGGSWSRVGGGLPDAELRELAADPRDPSRVFIATKEGLYRSTDGGASFGKLGGPLAEEDVEAVVVAPDGTAFAGTFHGVFRSADGGETWSAASDGLPNTDVRALAVGGAPARLWAGIAGGSVWSLALP